MSTIVLCEDCGRIIFDPKLKKDTKWKEAPCGDKVCEPCCIECSIRFDPLHECNFRQKARNDK